MKQVRIAGSGDKRQITATPVTARTGEVVQLQLLWRGKSTLCHPRGQEPHAVIYHDHTEKKMQNTGSFVTLLKRTAAALVAHRQRHALHADTPAILVVDNVSSHNPTVMEEVGGIHKSSRLYKARDCNQLYLFFGLPNRCVLWPVFSLYLCLLYPGAISSIRVTRW